jgi:hypothetical protein
VDDIFKRLIFWLNIARDTVKRRANGECFPLGFLSGTP